MSHDNLILGELDAQHLQNLGLLRPGRGTGSRRIHKRRLNRSSDEEYGNLSLDINPNSPAAASAYATIPTTLISRETLEYMGLSVGKTNEIWNEWTHWPETGPRREVDPENGGLQVSFIDFITARFDNYEDVFEDNDAAWRQCLGVCGISLAVQNAIMDPAFKTLRLTNSCIFWVKDTLFMRYSGLEDIRRASMLREMELQRITGHAGGISGGSGGGGGGNRGSIGQGDAERGGNLRQSQRSVSGMQQQATAGISSTLWSSSSSPSSLSKPGHVILYKGIDQGRIAGLFNNHGEIDNIAVLTSSPPSDFSGTRSLFYFTPDHKVAEYYAAYAKRRANCESVVMVCMCVPQAAIDELEEPDIQRLFWLTPQWKQLVWRSKTNRSLPKTLRKYRDALLIIGTISKGAERKYQNMESWEEMTDACLLRIGMAHNNPPAVQYVFSAEEEGREFLQEHGTIDVFGFSEVELQRILTRHS